MLIVLVIALVILGPKKLPQAGRALGSGMREFKDSITGTHKEDREPAKIEAAQTEAAATTSSTASAEKQTTS